jgi:DNA-binding transcriptional LysR family regulator
MESQKLKFFLAVAQEQNLTRASQKLNTVQSNVTVRLKQLEEEVGHQLFERSKKGMILTEKGHKLLPLAKDLLEKQSHIKRVMNEESPPCGQLAIGCLESFIRISLKDIIPQYVKTYPKVQLEIQTAFNEELFSLLMDGKIDIAGVVDKYNQQRFESIYQHKEKLILISNRNNHEELPLLILAKDCILGKTLKEHISSDRKILRIASIESIMHCVNAGIGISLLPKSIVETFDNYPALIKQDTPYECTYSLIRKRGRCLNSCEIKLMELLNQLPNE